MSSSTAETLTHTSPPVNVTTHTNLTPEHLTNEKLLPSPILGPLDQMVFPHIPIAVVYIYKMKDTAICDPLLPFPLVKKSMRRLLDYYSHLTGRLCRAESDSSIQITDIGKGADLLDAECSLPLSAYFPDCDQTITDNTRCFYDVTMLPDGGNSLLPPLNTFDFEDVRQKSILAMKITRFSCGSVSLGVKVNHCVCDADGFFSFMRNFAEIYRGYRKSTVLSAVEKIRSLCEEVPDTGDSDAVEGNIKISLSNPPQLQPYLASLTQKEQEAALKYVPKLLQLIPSEIAAQPFNHQPSYPVVGKILRYSVREIADLKRKATDDSENGRGWVSTYEALSAHLYQRIYSARYHHTLSTGGDLSTLSTDFLTPVNYRGSHRLNIPQNYFGNCLLCHVSNLPSEELLRRPLSDIATAVHGCVQVINKEDAEKTVRWISAQPEKTRIQSVFQAEVGGFMISQWCKFGMFRGVDFDVDVQGSPVTPCLVSPPFTPVSNIDGLTFLLSTEHELNDDSKAQPIDVSLALISPLWDILDKDPLFHRKM